MSGARCRDAGVGWASREWILQNHGLRIRDQDRLTHKCRDCPACVGRSPWRCELARWRVGQFLIERSLNMFSALASPSRLGGIISVTNS